MVSDVKEVSLMKSIVRNLSALLAVTLVASHHAFACVPVAAVTPEIDPSMGSGALALLAGAIMVIRGRAPVK